MTKEYAYIHVQCSTPDGSRGNFLTRDGSRTPVSPVFGHLDQLYRWMRAEGWERDEYTGEVFYPWRVSRAKQDNPAGNLTHQPEE